MLKSPKWSTFQALPSMAASWTYQQLLDQIGKAFQGKTV
jgi:hypothetical protein